ncbi:putative mucin TcMUCII [Trypanosoma cruzi]|uniref:Mucin TcMUCII, putative n=2 Tax=Trypanosoma cruzi TaxID=5693 RepID=Q4DSZ9_TRYCC|nr:mucin TcMUCII, putative [Trypanosoma cruzi]EAN95651.1 mucin TcMUCII, putative [Trypanosoma cruzi]KAF5214731.1 hypothetical protein ECC02_012634 [Trypanosoma cruzi]PWU93571.1 putative mucin TcMUCII [Trypanosoma cruzi]RNC59166.1 mucin TcMUCII [Trypanosoma cruzi]|eukprot:XP_817502.1 mucin TcMUCII [Trypanosoma cruzi strain CL Brener]
MVTTCRLLCALLVLALCCCPSVCVMANVVAEKDGPSESETPPEEPGRGANSLNSNTLTFPEAGKSGLQDKAHNAVEGKGPGVSSTEQTKRGSAPAQSGPGVGDIDSPGATGNSGKSVVNNSEQDKEVSKNNEEAKVQIPNTTTTTTNALTTTTTTTTTAPEAPSNTVMNTEAPTTTTTHAPSRLREIDGSLSSSAWVCVPLLLAVSALACAAVG